MFIRHFPFRLLSILLVTAALLSACDDPSEIGMSLVDSQAGEAEVTTLGASAIDDFGMGDITGGTASSGALRALSGTVEDPVIGSFSMTGYLDFVPSNDVDDAFRSGSIDFAELVLNIDYVYGDTTSLITLDLFEIDQSWSSTNARADTFFSAGNKVTSFTFMPVASMVHIPLPSGWTSSNDSRLRSTSFVDDFHGFAVRASSGNAVIGIHFAETAIRASSVPGDTVSFSLSKVMSSSTEQNSGSVRDYHILRDGAASAISIQFPFDADEFGQAAIHRVIMRLNSVNLDSLYPAGFKRGSVSLVGLRAVAIDELTRLTVREVTLAEDGSLTFDGDVLTNIVQSANLGDSGLDRFELFFAAESSTVDFIAFRTGLPESEGPRTIITYTPLN